MLNIEQLNINPIVVCRFISRAREFQAKEEVTIPEPSQNTEYEYDTFQVLADHSDDLTYLEVKNAVESLPYEEQLDLLALMYIGREDFDVWEEALECAVNNFQTNLTDYLLGHPLIADYLEKALGAFGQTCDDDELNT